MTTNTKTRQAKPVASPIAEAIAAAQIKRNTGVEAIQAKIALIDSHLPAILRRAQDVEDGAGETADIEHQLARLEDLPEGAYARSMEADLIAKVQAEKLPKRRAALIKSLPGESTILAEHIKPLFEAMLPGVEVIATTAPAGTWQGHVPGDAVGVVLVQEPTHNVDRYTGLLSGAVSVHYFRLPLYAPVNVEALERAAKAARINLEVSDNSPADRSAWRNVAGASQQDEHDPNTTVCDRLTINVSNVIDGLPTTGRRVDTSGLHSREWVTAALRQNGSQASGVPVDPKRYPYLWKVVVGAHVWVTGHPADVQSDDASAGRRTVVVTQKINTHNVDPSDFVGNLRTVLANALGSVSTGLGLLESADVKEVSGSRTDRTANYGLVLTYVSKAPGDQGSSA